MKARKVKILGNDYEEFEVGDTVTEILVNSHSAMITFTNGKTLFFNGLPYVAELL